MTAKGNGFLLIRCDSVTRCDSQKPYKSRVCGVCHTVTGGFLYSDVFEIIFIYLLMIRLVKKKYSKYLNIGNFTCVM